MSTGLVQLTSHCATSLPASACMRCIGGVCAQPHDFIPQLIQTETSELLRSAKITQSSLLSLLATDEAVGLPK